MLTLDIMPHGVEMKPYTPCFFLCPLLHFYVSDSIHVSEEILYDLKILEKNAVHNMHSNTL